MKESKDKLRALSAIAREALTSATLKGDTKACAATIPADDLPCLQCDWPDGDMMPAGWWALYCRRCG